MARRIFILKYMRICLSNVWFTRKSKPASFVPSLPNISATSRLPQLLLPCLLETSQHLRLETFGLDRFYLLLVTKIVVEDKDVSAI